MAQFYICHNKQKEAIVNQLDFDQHNLNLSTAGRYLSKVALRIADIRTKLTLNKISQFLEKTHLEMQEMSNQTKIYELVKSASIQNSNKTSFIQDESNKQNHHPAPQNQVTSLVRLSTAKSFITDSKISIQKITPRKEVQRDSQLIQAFQWRHVQTKNNFDDHQRNRKNRVRFEQEDDEMDEQIKERLEQQNKILQGCLKNIFSFFQERQLITYAGTHEIINKKQYQQFATELTRNFQNYSRENNSQIQNMMNESNYLQQKIKGLSTPSLSTYEKICMQQKMGEQQKLGEEANPSQKCYCTQVDFEPDEAEQLRQLTQQYERVQENSKKYEMVIFIKDEEINNLKTIVSDFQNKLKGVTSLTQSRVRSRSYKKFFQNLEEKTENMSSTVS